MCRKSRNVKTRIGEEKERPNFPRAAPDTQAEAILPLRFSRSAGSRRPFDKFVVAFVFFFLPRGLSFNCQALEEFWYFGSLAFPAQCLN